MTEEQVKSGSYCKCGYCGYIGYVYSIPFIGDDLARCSNCEKNGRLEVVSEATKLSE